MKLKEAINKLEITTLCLIKANNAVHRLALENSRLRYEKHVYKVEMNRCRRKLEAVYKFCDSIMIYEHGEDWKSKLAMYRKNGWL